VKREEIYSKPRKTQELKLKPIICIAKKALEGCHFKLQGI
jgi:hypothetical protein